MLDPFPFGGGVTTLESLSVCTPVITLPSRQSVPQLAAGMIQTMLGSNEDDKELSGEREGFNDVHKGLFGSSSSSKENVIDDNNRSEHKSSTKIIRDVMIVNDVQQYVLTVLTLLLSAKKNHVKMKKFVHPSIESSIINSSSLNRHNDIPSILSIRKHICDQSYKIYSQHDSVREWEKFFTSVSSYVI